MNTGKNQVIILQQPEPSTAPKTHDKQTLKRTLVGFSISILSTLLNVMSNILVKRSTFFTAFEFSFVQYVITFFVMLIGILYYNVSPLGPTHCRKLLLARGCLGPFSLLAMFTSLKLIDPSDSIALLSFTILFVAILGRIFLREKISIVYVFSTLVILVGALLITQPRFIIDPTKEMSPHRLLGMLLALMSAFLYAIITIIFKKIEPYGIHIYVINVYSAFFGIPICLLVWVGHALWFPKSRDFGESSIFLEILCLAISGVLGVASALLLIVSLKYDKAVRISMYRTTDLMFTFLFQYFVLQISADFFKACGVVFIMLGITSTVLFRVCEKSKSSKIEQEPNADTVAVSSEQTKTIKDFI